MTVVPSLAKLQQRHPEWGPWLTLVGAAFDELEHPAWRDAVPALPASRAPDQPLLARAEVTLPQRLPAFLDALIECAAGGGAPHLATVCALPRTTAEQAAATLQAVLNDDRARVGELSRGADVAAFSAVASLSATPFLHACNRAWAGAVAADWSEGFCPICGAWPACAEVCGVDRTRYLRCRGCAAAWSAGPLRCPFCGMDDHQRLGSLVADDRESEGSIDVCEACRGYLKVFSVLQPRAAREVMLRDLDSVLLDLAATARGYRPQPRTGCSPSLTVSPRAARGLAI